MNRSRKNKIKLFISAAFIIALIASVPAITKSITPEDIQDAMDKAKDYEQHIDTHNEHTEKMTEEAQKSYQDYKKRTDEIKFWQDRIDYDDQKVIVRDRPTEEPPSAQPKELGDLMAKDERIYIFISSSMPKETIRNYAKSMNKLIDSRIVMALRGCIGGCEKIMPTVKWIQDIVAPTEESQLAAEIIIDPYLFHYYNVTTVPTIIYATKVDPDMDQGSEGLTENLKNEPNAYSIIGDVSLEYALEKFSEESKSENLAHIAKKLRQGEYAH